MKIRSVHDIPYQMTFFSTDEGFPLGSVGTRMLMDGNETYTDLGWFMISKTAPPGTSQEIIRAVEINADRKSKYISAVVHEEDEYLRKTLLDYGFTEVKPNRFKKKAIL